MISENVDYIRNVNLSHFMHQSLNRPLSRMQPFLANASRLALVKQPKSLQVIITSRKTSVNHGSHHRSASICVCN